MTDLIKPAVGQVWEDWDSRVRPRGRHLLIVEVHEGAERPYVVMEIVRDAQPVVVPQAGRRVRVQIKRLRPNSTGYKLVKEADGE